jgi:hypothetical protein
MMPLGQRVGSVAGSEVKAALESHPIMGELGEVRCCGWSRDVTPVLEYGLRKWMVATVGVELLGGVGISEERARAATGRAARSVRGSFPHEEG